MIDDDTPAPPAPRRAPGRTPVVAVGGGGPYPEVDLDRPREQMVAEDEEQYG